MKKGMIIVALVLICAVHAWAEQPVRLDRMPPSVVATFPVSGATDVDPAVTEIRVTFSKDMMTENMWSWVMISRDAFPQITGKVRYVDKRTCVAPVKLEPGKTYAIWFNSQNNNAFRDTRNNPAVPYLLVFRTRGN